jgi:hypothetical protein
VDNGLLARSLIVLILGLVVLFTPDQTTAGLPANTSVRIAGEPSMCGGFCGVCQSSFYCPDVEEQNNLCSSVCGLGWISCDDCSPNVDGCEPSANTSWWCH